jgi:hypothetical protein
MKMTIKIPDAEFEDDRRYAGSKTISESSIN